MGPDLIQDKGRPRHLGVVRRHRAWPSMPGSCALISGDISAKACLSIASDCQALSRGMMCWNRRGMRFLRYWTAARREIVMTPECRDRTESGRGA